MSPLGMCDTPTQNQSSSSSTVTPVDCMSDSTNASTGAIGSHRPPSWQVAVLRHVTYLVSLVHYSFAKHNYAQHLLFLFTKSFPGCVPDTVWSLSSGPSYSLYYEHVRSSMEHLQEMAYGESIVHVMAMWHDRCRHVPGGGCGLWSLFLVMTEI